MRMPQANRAHAHVEDWIWHAKGSWLRLVAVRETLQSCEPQGIAPPTVARARQHPPGPLDELHVTAPVRRIVQSHRRARHLDLEHGPTGDAECFCCVASGVAALLCGQGGNPGKQRSTNRADGGEGLPVSDPGQDLFVGAGGARATTSRATQQAAGAPRRCRISDQPELTRRGLPRARWRVGLFPRPRK